MSDPEPYKAGRETDILVSERFFKRTVYRTRDEYPVGYHQTAGGGGNFLSFPQELIEDRATRRVPCYSTVLSVAWEEIAHELMEGDGTEFLLEYSPRELWPREAELADPEVRWRAFTCLAGTDMGVREAYASTPELALCRLALLLEDTARASAAYTEKNAQYRDEQGVFHYRNGKLIDPKTGEIVVEATP